MTTPTTPRPRTFLATQTHQMRAVERRILRWLDSDPLPEHREHIAALLAEDDTEAGR